MAPRTRLIHICVYVQNLKTIPPQIISKKVHANSLMHRQIISQIKKRSGVGVEAVWSTLTPGSLPRLRATPTPTPHPCSEHIPLELSRCRSRLPCCKSNNSHHGRRLRGMRGTCPPPPSVRNSGYAPQKYRFLKEIFGIVAKTSFLNISKIK